MFVAPTKYGRVFGSDTVFAWVKFSSRQLKKPTRGILKGGAYGCQEKSQEESQKEKEVTFDFWCEVVVVN